MGNFSYILRAATDFIFRRRSTGIILIRVAAGLLIASIIGWSFGLELPTKYGPLSFEFDNDASSLSIIVYFVAAAGVVGTVVGFMMLFFDYKRDSKKNYRDY